MVSDLPPHVTVVLDPRTPTGQLHLIGRLFRRHRGSLAVRARHLIHLRHITDPAFGADDAVQLAVTKVVRASVRGKLDSHATEEQLLRILRRALKQEVLDEQGREHAFRRKGPVKPDANASRSVHLAATELDVVDTHARLPEDEVAAADSLEQALAVLDAHDPTLRRVAIGLAFRLTRREIAAALGISRSAIDQKVHVIKAVLARKLTDKSVP